VSWNELSVVGAYAKEGDDLDHCIPFYRRSTSGIILPAHLCTQLSSLRSMYLLQSQVV
jgi:hypothetical protein